MSNVTPSFFVLFFSLEKRTSSFLQQSRGKDVALLESSRAGAKQKTDNTEEEEEGVGRGRRKKKGGGGGGREKALACEEFEQEYGDCCRGQQQSPRDHADHITSAACCRCPKHRHPVQMVQLDIFLSISHRTARGYPTERQEATRHYWGCPRQHSPARMFVTIRCVTSVWRLKYRNALKIDDI